MKIWLAKILSLYWFGFSIGKRNLFANVSASSPAFWLGLNIQQPVLDFNGGIEEDLPPFIINASQSFHHRFAEDGSDNILFRVRSIWRW